MFFLSFETKSLFIIDRPLVSSIERTGVSEILSSGGSGSQAAAGGAAGNDSGGGLGGGLSRASSIAGNKKTSRKMDLQRAVLAREQGMKRYI